MKIARRLLHATPECQWCGYPITDWQLVKKGAGEMFYHMHCYRGVCAMLTERAEINDRVVTTPLEALRGKEL